MKNKAFQEKPNPNPLHPILTSSITETDPRLTSDRKPLQKTILRALLSRLEK